MHLFLVFFIDGSGEHHKESEEDVEIVRFVDLLVYFCQELAKDVGTGLVVQFFSLVEFGLLFLRIEIHVDLVKVAAHVDLFQTPIVLVPLYVSHEVAQPVNAVGSDVLGVAVTVVYLLLK